MALPPIYHIDACAGTGMFGLAARLALGGRLRTVAYVEREARAAANLVARMEDAALDRAPVWDDMSTIMDAEFVGFVCQFRPLLLTAGYPCQPFSFAGLRLGERDERHLWPHLDAFIGAACPELVFFENVSGHVRLGLESVRRDLEKRGYRVAIGLFSAAEVGAGHERERVFILAHAQGGRCGMLRQSSRRHGQSDRSDSPVADANGSGQRGGGLGEGQHDYADFGVKALADAARVSSGQRTERKRVLENNQALANSYRVGCNKWTGKARSGEASGRQSAAANLEIANSGGAGLSDAERDGSSSGSTAELRIPLFAPGPDEIEQWRAILEKDPTLEPSICGTANGLAPRLDSDRLRLAGNGVVPLVGAYAFVTLAAALLRG